MECRTDDESALRIDERLRKVDETQRTFNEWVLERGEGLLREFIESFEA